mmetsp:Transcript_10896/g.16334  ORF Transcript_10896/g.16334 Transcript_10896/m.16334 type:complete len:92 (-) Transcript_10896:50-325(-)
MGLAAGSSSCPGCTMGPCGGAAASTVVAAAAGNGCGGGRAGIAGAAVGSCAGHTGLCNACGIWCGMPAVWQPRGGGATTAGSVGGALYAPT